MDVPGPTEGLEANVPNPISPGVGQVSSPKDNIGVAIYITCAVVLWKRVVKYLKLGGIEKDSHLIWDPMSQFADLQRQLGRLRNDLPIHLVFNEANLRSQAWERVANHFLYLHIIHAQIALTLNRFAISAFSIATSPKDIPKYFLAEAARDTMRAAAQISRLLKQANEHMPTEPFAGYCAYTSSTIHIWAIFAAKNENMKTSLKENLQHNYEYLKHMKRYSGMSHYIIESIKERYQHTNISSGFKPTLGQTLYSQTLGLTHPNTKEDTNAVSGRANIQDQENGDAQKPPFWSELLTKAGNRRKRLPLACSACRKKKIRCFGEKPCKSCSRAGLFCVYEVTAQQAAPRTDYMAILEDLQPPFAPSLANFDFNTAAPAIPASSPNTFAPSLDSPSTVRLPVIAPKDRQFLEHKEDE